MDETEYCERVWQTGRRSRFVGASGWEQGGVGCSRAGSESGCESSAAASSCFASCEARGESSEGGSSCVYRVAGSSGGSEERRLMGGRNVGRWDGILVVGATDHEWTVGGVGEGVRGRMGGANSAAAE